MSFFKNSGSYNDIHGNVHSFSTFHTTRTHIDSFSTNSNRYDSSPHSNTASSISAGSVVTSFKSYAAIETFSESLQRLDYHPLETAIEALDAPETENGNIVEEVEDAEDIVEDEDCPINGTYHFHNCQTVYVNAFNARGIQVKDSGNNAPRVTHRGGTVVVRHSNDELAQSAPSPSTTLPHPPQPNQTALGQSPRHPGVRPTPIFGPPTNFPGAGFQLPPINPFPAMHTGPHPNILLSSILQRFPNTVQNTLTNGITASKWSDTPSQPNRVHPSHYPTESPLGSNSPRDPTDANLGRLEHLLESTLATALTAAQIIQTSRTSRSLEILSPQAQSTLNELNVLVSGGMPVSSASTTESDIPTRFRSVSKVARWLRISRSPKKSDSASATKPVSLNYPLGTYHDNVQYCSG